MTRAIVRAIAGLILLVAYASADARCGAGKDLLVRALERVRTDSPKPDIEDALQLIKTATSECAGLGDAWYYRSLFEKKLGRANLADYALRKAKLVGSEALDQHADPFTLSAPPDRPPPGPVQRKFALVVGISKFRDRHINRLRYTSKDAEDFAAVLGDRNIGRFRPENVHKLIDDQATSVGIKTELNWLARSAGPDDLVVVYLASHGSERDRDTAGVNYVITHDTDVTDQDSLFATALPMVDVVDVLRTRIKARRAAVFLDTCHSGGAVAAGVKGASASASVLDRFRQGFGRVVITSSQVNETSWESEKIENGYFTHFLIDALKKDRGLSPLGQVYDYVRTVVAQHVKADQNAPQNPVMSKSELGSDIVLGVAPLTARVMPGVPQAPRIRSNPPAAAPGL